MSLWSFQGARRRQKPAKREKRRSTARSLKTQQCVPGGRTGQSPYGPCLDIASDVEDVEVDVVLGELDTGRKRTAEPDRSLARHPSNERAPTGVRAPVFPRKEVIQPQLPLRLPCYDFTPVTNPTFDGSLPCGLGHRLRVLPTFVV